MAEIATCIANAKTLEPEGLHRPIDYLDSVVDLFHPDPGVRTGYTLPFEDIRSKLYFRPGEVTIWSGETGSGKSILLSYATVGWVEEGSVVCMASFELEPVQTLRRMVKQAANVGGRPSEAMIRQALEWLTSGLLIFDLVGKGKLDTLLEIFEYARARYGCDQFIIDSFMRLGVATDDYNAQEQAVFKIVDWAVAKRVHVHLIAHTRKSDQDRRPPTADDVKGTMEITANAANILLIWRNRPREELEKRGEPVEEKAAKKYREEINKAGVVLRCVKQRNGDWEGSARLWFNQGTYQYRGPSDGRNGRDFVRLPGGRDPLEEVESNNSD